MIQQDINAKFQLARKVVFGTLTVFSLVLIVLSAIIINRTSNGFGWYYPYAALAIATAILTLFTLPVMLFLSIKRSGAITSMIAVEVAWTWFLWILWISVGGNSASYTIGCGGYVGYYSTYLGYDWSLTCQATQALAAFAFLGWVLLFAYNISLITFVIRLHMRGHTTVWTSYVTETDFTAAPAHGGAPTEAKFAPQYPASTVTTPGAYPNPSPGPHYPQV